MDKIYLVIEFGGEYEDKWEHIVAACETSEIADSIKEKRLNKRARPVIKISEEEWSHMYDKLCTLDEWDDDFVELHRMFPQYSMEDIKLASEMYDNYDDFGGVWIKEVDFYGNKS